MTSMTWADYWWNRITGPSEVVREVADALSEESNCVVVNVPDNLPWRHEMRYAVKESLQSRLDVGDIAFRQIDGDELPSENLDPGAFLLDRFARTSDKRSYRPRIGHSIQSYLMDKHVLRNQVVWLKGLGGTWARVWLEFCRGYRPSTMDDGLIVLEMRGASQSECGGLTFVDLARRITLSDARLMNSVVVTEGRSGLPDLWRRYEAALATHLCGTDVEVSEALIELMNIERDNPIDVIKRLSTEVSFARRGAPEDDHVLSICRRGDKNLLKRRVWEAQVEVLYPIVESERLAIVDCLSDDLNNLVAAHEVFQFNEAVDDPRDLELGTLVYLIGSHRLRIDDPALRDRIHFLRDCRNSIAHMNCCPITWVTRLINEQYH